MLTEPFESDTKKWSKLSEIVKENYRKINEINIKPSFSFKISNLLSSDGEQIGIRCYCLGSINNSTESTLLYCDITNNENVQFNKDGPLVDFENLNKIYHLNNGDLNEDDNLELPTFKWKELIDPDLVIKDEKFNEKLSIEEKLQLERKRLLVTGIVAYEFHEQQKRFIFSLDGSLHYFDDNGQAPLLPIKLPSKKKSAKINPAMCPSNSNLVAYVNESDLYVLNIETGIEIQLTNNKVDEPSRKLISGLPSYVVQEEFDRYIGFWWQPIDNQSCNHYRILFEVVDETDVELIRIGDHEYRYPRPGKNNATSLLKIAEFKLDTTTKEFFDINVNLVNNISDLKMIYSEYEYLTNCGWHSSESIVVQLLNRKQKNLLVFLISLNGAFEPQVIHEEINNNWINVTHVCEFIKKKDDDEKIEVGKQINFIWASQETGFRHLYKISAKLTQSNGNLDNENRPLRSTIISKVQLTSGNWEVSSEGVWLDSKNDLVYFIGLKDSPLEKQLYVISLNNELEPIKKLTNSGYSNSIIIFNSQFNIFLNIQSSISKSPFGFLNVIQNYSSSQRLPSTHRIGYIISNKILKPDGNLINPVEQFELLPGFSRPELFSYQLKKSGDIVYGLIYKPDFMQADKKYPCVLEVYGGPCVQLITNTFKSVRLFSRHLLASQGYVVCAFDCRGSSNRGMAFESHLNRRLGQVEVDDQVEVLQWLASNTNYIDLNRVAVYGFSYGGYLSLLCYATRPDIFKLSIAGAPVTNWELYDTGYTERYMGLPTPEDNLEGYAKGSILNQVQNFPNEERRLLIIHGLNDENVHFQHSSELIYELVKAGKPYDLQIYPHERHSFRNIQTRLHAETALLSFLNKNL